MNSRQVEAPRKRVIVVLGIRRGGLTEVTRALQILGIGQDAGPDRLRPDADRAFWAEHDCGDINEQLLKLLGVRHPLDLAWDDVPEPSSVDALEQQAIELVSRQLRQREGTWGFADAETSRLLWFWVKVLAGAGAEVTYVIAVRSPGEVERFLGDVPRDKAYLLWLQHVLPALHLTKNAQRIVVDYDDLAMHLHAQLARLADRLQLALPAPGSTSEYDLEESLGHVRAPEDGSAADTTIPPLVADVYGLARRLASDREWSADADALKTLDSLKEEFQRRLSSAISGRLKQLVVDHEVRIASLSEALADRDRQLDAFRHQLALRDRAMAALTASTSWRITSPLRAAKRLLVHGGRRLGTDRPVSALEREVPVPVAAIPQGLTDEGVGALGGEAGGQPAAQPSLPPGGGQMHELPEGFDRAVYLAVNPDVAAANLDPAEHYLQFGQYEGRTYRVPVDDVRGGERYRRDRETVLIVSHDASRTGAPMLSLNLVHQLVDRYNVVVLSLNEGPLNDAFVLAGAVTCVIPTLRTSPFVADLVIARLHDRYRFKYALVNSIESRAVLPELGRRYVPTISLIHEFAAYTRPRDAFPRALLWSTEVVFSAAVTRQNMQQEVRGMDERPVKVLPQGQCLVPAPDLPEEQLAEERARVRDIVRPRGSKEGMVVVLGAGSVHLRKGPELFIECATRVLSAVDGRHCRFVWFGYGYDPDRDAAYSAYLSDQIKRAGIAEHIVFTTETVAIETAYESADIFMLSSRLDPLPNVAIDALVCGLPVLCFDRATGIAEFLHASGLGDACVARYLDTADMGEKILAFVRSPGLRREIGERAREASATFFSMKEYVARLESLAQEACDKVREEQRDVETILASGLFQTEFSVPPSEQPTELDLAVRTFVRGWASGVAGRRKPFPGFHPGIYREQRGVMLEGADPTADYIRAGRPEGQWTYPLLTGAGEATGDLPESRRVVVHLHAFYSELLPDILAPLGRNRIAPDILVSVPDRRVSERVKRALEHYAGRVVAVEIVPNRGRDIGPFLTTFGRHILANYDYVGHLHTKKTPDIGDAAFVRHWNRFLFENLLGSESAPMADTILSAMNADASLGIVFPDDPHVLGWDGNRSVAEPLAARLGIESLPSHFNFPVGTMFWARTRAVAPLVDLGLQWSDYPDEPLPYDGTLLHAIERLFPLVASRAGLRAVATHVPGVTR